MLFCNSLWEIMKNVYHVSYHDARIAKRDHISSGSADGRLEPALGHTWNPSSKASRNFSNVVGSCSAAGCDAARKSVRRAPAA